MSRESHDILERRALELLPWYVNGTLNDEERELVSRQALTSLPCRKELERLRRLHEQIQHDDAEAAATGRAFERLMARIDATGAPSRSGARQPRRWLASKRLAVAASLAAIVLLPLWWETDVSSTTPRIYETLTRTQAVAPGTMHLRVVFAPGVTGQERQELLARHGLTIVGSPTSEGIVTLELPDESSQAAIVAALRRDPRIRLVTTPPGTSAP